MLQSISEARLPALDRTFASPGLPKVTLDGNETKSEDRQKPARRNAASPSTFREKVEEKPHHPGPGLRDRQ
jgi:hypothetical protein